MRSPSRRRHLVALSVSALALSATGCEEWNVESCQPTRVEIESVGETSVVASLESGGIPLRGRRLGITLRAGGEAVISQTVEVERDGTARAEFGAEALDVADSVTATHADDPSYCEGSATAPA